MSAKAVRLFVSSPGDVCAERTIADRVIRKLQKEYQGSLNLIPVLWEDLPLTAHGTFQEEINAALAEAPVDIAIFILGGRLGSSPGKNFLRPDGTPYASGTEYEFDLMMGSYRRLGRPEILVYRKKVSPAQMLATDAGIADVSEAVRQMQDLENFVEERFHDKEKGAYIAYHRVDDALTFENRLTEHLRGLLSKVNSAGRRKLWQGNPYKGLLSFEQEDEAIFFGRSNALNQLEKPLWDQLARNEMPLVFVCGGSGSGKSSLVKAGLVPDLVKSSVLQKTKVCPRIVTPQQWKGSLCDGLWGELRQMFLRLPAMPSPANADFVGAVADLMRMASDLQIKENTIRTVPLIVIDQFEETFTDSRRTQEDVRGFALLLQAVRRSGRVIVAATLRNDFYHYLTDREEWLELRQAALVWDIPRMSASEFAQVIAEPAAMAGLEWEREEQTGKPLNEVILDDAIRMGLTLPLLEFALTALVETSEKERLTYAAYRALGGVQGSIQKRADEIFTSFTATQRNAFFDILTEVVTIDPVNGTFVRREADVAGLRLDEGGRKVLQMLIDNRLFSVSGGTGEEPVVTVAHELLLSRWDVIVCWLASERELLEERHEIEAAEAKWSRAGKKPSMLLEGARSLAVAEDLLICYGSRLPARLLHFIRSSFKRKTRKWIGLPVIGALLLSACGAVFAMAGLRSNGGCVLLSVYDTLGIEIAEECLKGNMVFFVPGFALVLAILLLRKVVRKWRGYTKSENLGWDFAVWLIFLALQTYSCARTCSTGWEGIVIVDILIFLIIIGALCMKGLILRYARLRQSRKVGFEVISLVRKSVAVCQWGVEGLALFGGLILFGVVIYCFAVNSNPHLMELGQQLVTNERRMDRMAFFGVNGMRFDFDMEIVRQGCRPEDEDRPIDSFRAAAYLNACYNVGEIGRIFDDDMVLAAMLPSDRTNLLSRIYNDMGKREQLYELDKGRSDVSAHIKVFESLLIGRMEDAKGWLEACGSIPVIPPGPHTVNFAHGLLLCLNERSRALEYYAEAVKAPGLRNSLLADFAQLRKQAAYAEAIRWVERNLMLSPLPLSGAGEKDVFPELKWLHGSWRWQVPNAVDLTWDLNPDCALTSVYHWHDCGTGKEFNRGFARVKVFRRGEGSYRVEEYYPRFGLFSIGDLMRIDDDTLELTIVYNGSDAETGTKRLLHRVSQNGNKERK